MFRLNLSVIVAVFTVATTPALAGPDDFVPGPLIPEYGNIVLVELDMPVPEETVMRVAFDVTNQADAGGLNRNITSAARFLNMHVASGVPAENIHLAIVLHGGSVHDVTRATHYEALLQTPNTNAPLIATLIEHGVEFYVCGQSAAYQDVENEDLLPGVNMALSAMTAHALLQQNGYTLNPF
jgi:intracellular sulfur oxidation DsrE/DsrF family protein